MRRLPVFLLIDTSESMVGDTIEALYTGMGQLLGALRKDPQTLEIGALSVLTFGATADVALPLTSVQEAMLPRLELSSGTSLGAAFDLLADEIRSNVVKSTPERRGDYRPIVFLITDGQPTDAWRPAVSRFRTDHPSIPIHAIGCGEDVDFSVLKEITPNTYFMREMDASAFGKLFACVSASVRSVTDSALNGGAAKDDLEEWAKGALRKPTAEECRPQSELRQVFLPVVCSTTKKDYLLRFRLDDSGKYYCAAAHKLEKPITGAEGSAQTINTARLGAPLECPYCGSPGIAKCRCGTLSCHSMSTPVFKCPQCGNVGMLGGGRSFDLNRSNG